MYETEARHYLREVLMAAIHSADEGCADWRIADALLDAGEITWNYQIRPEPQVATFQLIFTATDAEPASGGVVEPPQVTESEYGCTLTIPPSPSDRNPTLAETVAAAYGVEPGRSGTVRIEPSGPLTAEEATPDCGPPEPLALQQLNQLTGRWELAFDGVYAPEQPETLTVRLDNRDARFVPPEPLAPFFEGDEALPPEPGTCPLCGVHGTVRTVHLGEPSPPEGEALGVTDEHRRDFGKAIGDLRDRYSPRRQHDAEQGEGDDRG